MNTQQQIGSTYRLQLHAGFPFAAAREALPYLRSLGVNTLYLSPIFRARKGSMHGYDCIDMNEANPELGGAEGFHQLAEAVHGHGLRLILDIVPNHRVYDPENHLLMDVLVNARDSRHAYLFDINWDHPYENLHGRLLAPFLGDVFANCLLRGEFKLGLTPDGLKLSYFNWHFPVRPLSYVRIFQLNPARLHAMNGKREGAITKLNALIGFLANYDQERRASPAFDHARAVAEITWELYQESPIIRAHVDENIAFINGHAGDMESFNELSNLVKEQFYRPAFWKAGTEEINYRRFFTVNELIALRMHDDRVFEDTHAWILELLDKQVIDGVRIDHVDGLMDPTDYLRRLRQRAPDAFIVVEKILQFKEPLPKQWPIQGTTGYDFGALVTQVLCDPSRASALDKIHETFTGSRKTFGQIEQECKREMIDHGMPGDIDNLALLLKEIASRRRYGLDLTMHALKRALVEMLVHFPVYRTYITLENFNADQRQVVIDTLEASKRTLPDHTNELELIARCLLAPYENLRTDEERRRWFDFTLRFQQYTSPVMAKSVEDMAFYRYHRLLALNEVGNDPERFGLSLRDFHLLIRRRSASWNRTMNATSTHDSKRGEDARARLCALSAMPTSWNRHLLRWASLTDRHRVQVGSAPAPGRSEQAFLFQAMLGSLPFEGVEADDFRARLKAYMIKAAREASLATSWHRPNPAHEAALTGYIEAITDAERGKEFLDSFLPFAKRIAHWGVLNSLSQLTLRFTVPGIPDTYQGTEGWDLSFVDPDNRRGADFAALAQRLKELTRVPPERITDLLAHVADARIKTMLMVRLLAARNQWPEVFLKGDYRPLVVKGRRARHLIAFTREFGGRELIVVVPRFLNAVEAFQPLADDLAKWTAISAEDWGDTALAFDNAPRSFRDVVTGGTISASSLTPVRDILRNFPAALLASE